MTRAEYLDSLPPQVAAAYRVLDMARASVADADPANVTKTVTALETKTVVRRPDRSVAVTLFERPGNSVFSPMVEATVNVPTRGTQLVATLRGGEAAPTLRTRALPGPKGV